MEDNKYCFNKNHLNLEIFKYDLENKSDDQIVEWLRENVDHSHMNFRESNEKKWIKKSKKLEIAVATYGHTINYLYDILNSETSTFIKTLVLRNNSLGHQLGNDFTGMLELFDENDNEREKYEIKDLSDKSLIKIYKQNPYLFFGIFYNPILSHSLIERVLNKEGYFSDIGDKDIDNIFEILCDPNPINEDYFFSKKLIKNQIFFSIRIFKIIISRLLKCDYKKYIPYRFYGPILQFLINSRDVYLGTPYTLNDLNIFDNSIDEIQFHDEYREEIRDLGSIKKDYDLKDILRIKYLLLYRLYEQNSFTLDDHFNLLRNSENYYDRTDYYAFASLQNIFNNNPLGSLVSLDEILFYKKSNSNDLKKSKIYTDLQCEFILRMNDLLEKHDENVIFGLPRNINFYKNINLRIWIKKFCLYYSSRYESGLPTLQPKPIEIYSRMLKKLNINDSGDNIHDHGTLLSKKIENLELKINNDQIETNQKIKKISNEINQITQEIKTLRHGFKNLEKNFTVLHNESDKPKDAIGKIINKIPIIGYLFRKFFD